MKDEQIIELYWHRSESAITRTQEKYGGYCYAIAYNILGDNGDAEESVNDTYFAAWNAIPPNRPRKLAAYLGKITRYISLDRFKNRMAKKRGGGEVPLVLEELSECIPGGNSVESECLKKEFENSINKFLEHLPKAERSVFLLRYWYMVPVSDIAERFGYSESKVTSMLHRTRGKLGKMLRQEGIA